jgi:D-alanine-D-alanine ligase
MGISGSSIIQNERELRAQVRWVIETYQEPALVEEYIDGREITVGLLGNEQLRVFPPLEVDFSPCPAEEQGVYTSQIKSELYDLPRYLCPAPLTDGQVKELGRLAVAAFRALNCLDVARVDFRLDAHDGEKPYILEINPLPGLCPGVSDLVMQAEADGMSHTKLINAILNEALKRYPALARKAQAARSLATVEMAKSVLSDTW